MKRCKNKKKLHPLKLCPHKKILIRVQAGVCLKKYTDPYGSKFMLPFLDACNIVFTSLPWLPSVKGVGRGRWVVKPRFKALFRTYLASPDG